MGVVWRAVDTTLDREVAIKVLAEAVATDPDRLARFDREAKLLASLNHPNIASIYGFHECNGVRFVAMELVQGEDLSQRLARGPLEIDEALEFAVQIAAALAAAHDSGVVHRDLKPANVQLAPDGSVKVLDFGLAKSLGVGPVSGGGDPAASPTITTAGTALGVILGTAGYMSPEQARGRAVDRRADMWALGCVLYEMLTGRQAFPGETIPDILSAVLSREPDWERLPARTPPATRRLLRRCLEKNPTRRVRDAADARLELLEADAAAEPDAAPPPAGAGRLRRTLQAAGLVALGAIVAALILRPTARRELQRPADLLPPDRQVTFSGEVADLDLAADGRTAVYRTREGREAVLLDLDGGGSQRLYAAPSGSILDDVAWSPDGDRVYLMSWPYAGRVSSVARFGGEPRQELDLHQLAGLNGTVALPLAGGNWLVTGEHNTLYVGDDPSGLEADGTQLVGAGVFRIEGIERLGRVRVLASSDGRWLAFHGLDKDAGAHAGVTAGDPTVAPGLIDSWSGLTPVGWAREDRDLYLWRSTGLDVGDLLRVSMDPRTGRPTDEPTLVYPRLGARVVRVSRDGQRLAFVAGARVSNLQEISLDETPTASDNPHHMRTRGTGRWDEQIGFLPGGELLAALVGDLGWELFAIAEDGSRRSVARETRTPTAMSVSTDGRTIALAFATPGPALVLRDVAGGRSRTIDLPEELSSVDWSPDGTHLAGMTESSADRMVVVDVAAAAARSVTLDCGAKCEFAGEGIYCGPEWPFAAVTSEVDTWIVNVESGALRHLASNTWNVEAWLDPWVYITRTGQTDWPGDVLYRVPAAGGPEERLLDAPMECNTLGVAPGGNAAICLLDESRLDVRTIVGFDTGR